MYKDLQMLSSLNEKYCIVLIICFNTIKYICLFLTVRKDILIFISPPFFMKALRLVSHLVQLLWYRDAPQLCVHIIQGASLRDVGLLFAFIDIFKFV